MIFMSQTLVSMTVAAMTKTRLCRSQLPILALPLKLLWMEISALMILRHFAPVDETPISVFDADMLSKVTRGLGTPTTWVGNNTQEA
jgi:hypothetical protein